MVSAAATVPVPADSPEARRYNRIRRWLGVADFLLGLALMVVLLATGWSGALRDIAYEATFQHYSLALFLYVLMLMVLAKVLGLGLDYYSFRLEHRYQLSNMRLRAWLWDEGKGFLVGVVLAAIVAELLYFIMREAPQHWWLIAWAAFLGLFVLLAQLAPVVLFPIFYKFAPLENEELKERLVRLGERAGTRVRGVYQWKLSEKSKKANAALTGLGNTRRIILADTLLANYSTDEIEAVLAHELGHHVHRHIFKSILVQAGITFVGFWAANLVLHYAVDRHAHVRDPLRFCQSSVVDAGRDHAVVPGAAAAQRLLALQRAPGRPLCFPFHPNGPAFHFCHEQTGRAESGGTFSCAMGGVVFPFASGNFAARGRGPGLGKGSAGSFKSPPA